MNRIRDNMRIVHFAGTLKSWDLIYNSQTKQLSGNLNGQNETQREHLLSWWIIMKSHVAPIINELAAVSFCNLC